MHTPVMWGACGVLLRSKLLMPFLTTLIFSKIYKGGQEHNFLYVGVCGVWCVVCGVWCVVCGVWCVWCVVCGVCGVWCVEICGSVVIDGLTFNI